jgi:5-methylcytosine-specific restriction endonuclease McrA
MSLAPAVLDAMVAAGCTAEQIAEAIKASLREQEARKARAVSWLPLRDMAFARDGYRCTYCGDEAGPFEIDHIVPRIKGGENILENVTVACRRCNRSKKDREAPKL